MRNKKSATILIVCLIAFGVLILFSVKKLRVTEAQSGEPNLMVLIPSFLFNTLKHPTGLLVLPDPVYGYTYLYIADTGNHQIRRFKIGVGSLVVVSGTGAPGYVNGSTSVAQFNYPTGLSGTAEQYFWQDFYTQQIRAGTYHNVFISDTQNYVIRKLCANVGAGPYPPCQTVQTACGSNVNGMVDGPARRPVFPH